MNPPIYQTYGPVFGPRLKSKINVSWVNEDDQMTLCLNGFVLQRGVAEYALRSSIRE
jgi:hypothetical protein